MHVKLTTSGGRRYVQLVESYRDEAGRVKKRTVATLGRAEQVDGSLDAVINGLLTRVRQLRSQVLVFARAHFQKCHYNSANCSGAAGFSIPNRVLKVASSPSVSSLAGKNRP